MALNLQLVLTRQYKEGALAYMEEHPEDFEPALKIALSEEPHLGWRAAWLVFNCMTDNDPKIAPFLDQILNVLPEKKDGHQRELLKILMRMELTDDQQGFLFDHCVTLWESVRRTPSIRYAAFRMMVQIASSYPELKHEILVLTQPQFINTLSPGIKNSVRKMIAKLKD